MRAIVLHEIGPAENLRLEDIPRPSPPPGYVIVRVRAAGVCYRDVVDRRGGMPFMKRPVVLGHELSGEVVELGEGVTTVAIGDRVVNLLRAPCGACEMCLAGHEPRCGRALFSFGVTADGAYAEFVLAPVGSLVPIPANLEHERACFLACTAGAALRGLRTRGGLKPGDTALITGASGGVGLHALQVAKALGARVVAITSQDSKAAALREVGADVVVVSPAHDFHKRAPKADVVLDCVGTPTLNASIRSLKPMGRVVVVGNVTVERAEINPGLLILNELGVLGSAGCTRADLQQVLAWVAAGQVRPVLAEAMPLDRAADAHRRLEGKGVTGRLVLVP